MAVVHGPLRFVFLLFVAAAVFSVSVAAQEKVDLLEAHKLEDPTCTVPFFTNCQADSEFTTRTSVYSNIDDGDASTRTPVTTNKTNDNQFSSLHMNWFLEAVRPGDHFIRIYVSGLSGGDIPAGTTLRLLSYPEHGNITSNYTEVKYQLNSTQAQWFQIPVRDIVEDGHQMTNGYMVGMRVGANTEIAIGELWLYRPISLASDLSILNNGVTVTSATNNTVEHTWRVISSIAMNASNSSCAAYDVNTNLQMNVSFDIDFDIERQQLTARWVPTTDTFQEANSYAVKCSTTVNQLTDLTVTARAEDFTQYVYITTEQTVLDQLAEILSNVLEILGIVDRNDIAEAAAFDTLTVDISDASGFVGQDRMVSAAVTTSRVPIDAVDCSLDVFGPDSKWVDNQSMSFRESGIYEANVTLPSQEGTHRAITSCTNGVLNNTQVRGTTSWQVQDGNRMVSIT